MSRLLARGQSKGGRLQDVKALNHLANVIGRSDPAVFLHLRPNKIAKLFLPVQKDVFHLIVIPEIAAQMLDNLRSKPVQQACVFVIVNGILTHQMTDDIVFQASFRESC